MYDTNFQYYLAEKIDVSVDIITNLFESEKNPFDAALRLIEEHNVDADLLGKAWGDYMGFAYVNPSLSIISKEHINALGKEFILENKVLPLYKLGRAVTVSTPYPENPYIQDKLEKKLDAIVNFVFCFPFDIEICMHFMNL